MKRFTFYAFGLAVLLLLGGCYHALSKDALLSVDAEVDFATVQKDPQSFRGKTLLVGGQVMDVQAGREGTTLEILQLPLDRYGEPQTDSESAGRFLARTDRFLDPEEYKAGVHLAMTGTVEGVETRPLRGGEYPYPVLRIGEAHIWPSYPSEGYYPYRGFYPHGPGYYPYRPYWGPYPYYDPFWYPFGYSPYYHSPYYYW